MKKIVSFIVLGSLGIASYCQSCLITYAGNGSAGLVNGPHQNAQFSNPSGICKDRFGNLFIADGDNHVIRKIDPAGNLSTYAGTGIAGYKDGMKDTAVFDDPFDICTDDLGNVYVSDFNNQCIRKISVSGMVTTIAGNGIAGYKNGLGDTAQFNYPRGIVWQSSGNFLYIGDSWNHRIRKINLNTNMVSTFAGGGSISGVGSVGSLADGADSSARFYTPTGLSIDTGNNIYVADAYNHRIRKIDINGVVSTIAGSGPSGTGTGAFADGPAVSAQFNVPTEVYWSMQKGLLIGDTYNNSLRLLDHSDFVSTLAGNDTPGFRDSCITNLSLMNHPRGITASYNTDSIFIIDGNNHAIRLLYDEVLPTMIKENVSSFYIENKGAAIMILYKENMDEPKIEICDVLGRREFVPIQKSNDSMQLDLTALSAGIHFLSIDAKDISTVIKIVR